MPLNFFYEVSEIIREDTGARHLRHQGADHRQQASQKERWSEVRFKVRSHTSQKRLTAQAAPAEYVIKLGKGKHFHRPDSPCHAHRSDGEVITLDDALAGNLDPCQQHHCMRKL